MTETANPFTVFTKPWPEMSLPELADFVKGLGFGGVELPLRPGYQVTPDTISDGLPEAARVLGDRGIRIGSVAGPTDEKTIAACGEAGVPIIRICVGIDMEIGYMATEEKLRREYDALVPILDKHDVSIGVQNHCGAMVGSAVGIMHLIEKYDPKHMSAVLDPAHSAVDGEPEAMGLDIVWSHLSLINFKAAFRMRTNGPEDPEAKWKVHWTTGRHSGFSWSLMVNLLKGRGYTKDICLPPSTARPRADNTWARRSSR